MTSTVLKLTLRPAVGFRFQPTGFPDLGAATYQAHVPGEGWVQALHLESPQSMANRLELCTWDPAVSDQAEALRGLRLRSATRLMGMRHLNIYQNNVKTATVILSDIFSITKYRNLY